MYFSLLNITLTLVICLRGSALAVPIAEGSKRNQFYPLVFFHFCLHSFCYCIWQHKIATMVEQAYYQKPGQVIAAAAVLPVLDTLTLILRFYARRRQRLPLQADDWLTVPAVVGPTPHGD